MQKNKTKKKSDEPGSEMNHEHQHNFYINRLLYFE